MKYGFVKVMSASPHVRIADTAYNSAQIIAAVQTAESSGAKLLVLPELSVTGCTCRDLMYQDTLLKGALSALEHILRETCSTDVLAVVSLPIKVWDTVYTCAAAIHRGAVLAVVPKITGNSMSMPHEINLSGTAVPFGCNLLLHCGCMPELGIAIGFHSYLQNLPPVCAEASMRRASVNLCLSDAPELAGSPRRLDMLISSESLRYKCAYVLSSPGAGESVTDFVYTGYKLIGEHGSILASSGTDNSISSEIDLGRIDRARCLAFKDTDCSGMPPCREVSFDFELCSTDLTRKIRPLPFIPDSPSECCSRFETILNLMSRALASRMEHTKSKHAVIGLSGGLDSTLAILAAARSCKNTDSWSITAVTMPCFGTTSRTFSNAQALARALNAELRTIDIGKAVKLHFEDIGHDYDKHDVVFENAQARERTQVLMDIANDIGGLVVGTGDMSEMALGWATYNGDHMSMYGLNSGVPKTLVRRLVAHEAEHCGNPELACVLESILDTPVSPELLPAVDDDISQITEDLVGPYELHDFFLFHGIHWGAPPDKVLHMAKHAFSGMYSEKTIKKWLDVFFRRFFAQQFKRSAMPDGPAVGSLSLSPRCGWHMASDTSPALWR